MKVISKEQINVQLTRKDAKVLFETINWNYDSHLKSVRKQLKEELASIYEYKVQCSDCSRVFTIERKTKFTPAKIEPIRGGICINCSDNYK